MTFTPSVLSDGVAVSDYAADKITWKVEGAEKSGTKMDGNKLVVDPYETATELKVTASITEDGTTVTSDPITVTVKTSPVFTLEIKGSTEVIRNSSNDISAVVTKDSETIDYSNIEWTLSGNTDEATKLENGKLIVGNEPVDTVLTITASFTEYGIPHTETLEITVIAYKVEIDGYNEILPGKEATLNASIFNEGNPIEGTVKWEVEGAASVDDTVPNKLTITAGDQAGTIKVTATYESAAGTVITAAHEIAVNDYTVTVGGTDNAVSQGSDVTVTAGIKQNGETDITDAAITWKVTGMADGSVIEKNGYELKLTVNEPAGTVLTVTASIQVGGEIVSETYQVTVTDYVVNVTAPGANAAQGGEVVLDAEVSKGTEGVADAEVEWTVSGGSGATTISDGKLSIDAEEAVGTVLTVIATYTVDGMTVASEPVTITVTDYKIVVEPSAQEVPQGSVASLVATVTQGTNAVENPVISWKVSKTDGSTLEMNGTVLKLGVNEPIGTELTVIATTVIDGKTIVSAPVTVTVVAAPAYVVTITDPATSIKQGADASFAASVTKDGEAVTDAEIIWRVAGKTAAGTAIDSNGKLTIDHDEPVGTKLMVTASIIVDGDIITSEAATLTVTLAPKQAESYKTSDGTYVTLPSGVIYLSDENVVWVESVNLNGAAAFKNTAWNGAQIWIGGESNADVKDGTNFVKGIGVQPQAPTADNDRGASWTTIDVSELNCDTFYAAVGITNASNQQNGHNDFIFQVYGTYEDNGEFKLLAESDPIHKTETGEFNVDISGVKLLKLVIKCTETGTHGYGNSVWANACVYKATPDTYVIDVTGSANVVTQGEELTFTASATKNGEAMTDAVFTWTVSGAAKEGTTIDADGKLTVDAAEAAGTQLKVTASITVGEETYTSNAYTVTVKAVPQTATQTDAYKTSNGTYIALPNGVIYLSDVQWTESKNLSDIETIKDGTYKNGDSIWIGGESGGKVDDGTKFDKGLGVMAFAPNDGKNGAAHTIWDVSGLNVNTFYAAVGITNVNGQNYGYGDPYGTGTFAGGGVIFEVYGAYETDGEFKLLAESEVITKTTTGEFKVNIEGVKLLKLVVKCNLDTSSGHTSMNSAWGNACVYASTGTSTDNYSITASTTETTVEQGKNTSFTAAVTKNGEALTGAAINWTVTGAAKSGTTIDANGKLTIDKKEPAGTKLSVTASITVDGTTYTSAAVEITVAEAPSNYYQKDAFKVVTNFAELSDKVIYLSDVDWIESVNLNGAQAIKNGAWSNGGAIWIGGESNADVKDGTEFKKGIGVQCQAPNSENNNGASWTTIDVSKLDCDTFYAAVGLTNKSNQENGHNSFIFQVYGATETGGEFILLAESGALSKTETGEFTVDISDMKTLKLVIKCVDGGSHAYGNSVWANACVYNKDGSAGNPDGGSSGDKNDGEKPAQENAYTTFNGAYLTPSGTIIYLSDIEWTESINLSNIETIRDGTYKNGDPIWIGGASGGKVTDGTKFKKGLGVQPFAPNDGKNGASHTIWDVSSLNVNTFYGVVGITNANGQNYAFGDAYNDSTFAGGGVIFQVFGTYEDGGEFKLLAESEVITKTLTGEFKVDISGVKLLKLVVKCNLDTGSGHSSMNSAWGNACVFNSADGSLEAGATTEPTTKPTQPDSTKATRPADPTKATEPADGTGNNGGDGVITIFIIVGVVLLIAAAVVIALIVKKNKRR